MGIRTTNVPSLPHSSLTSSPASVQTFLFLVYRPIKGGLFLSESVNVPDKSCENILENWLVETWGLSFRVGWTVRT